MSKELTCTRCKYFSGIDGITEIWTSCLLFGDFKGIKKQSQCKTFEKKRTSGEIISELKRENERLTKSRDFWCEKTKEMTYYFNCLEKATEKTLDDKTFNKVWKCYDEMEEKWNSGD